MQKLARRTARVAIWLATPHLLPQRWARHKARWAEAAEERKLRRLAGLSGHGPRYLDLPQAIAFVPNQDSAAEILPAARNGTYQFSRERKAYSYLPPARSRDLEQQIAAMSPRPRFSIVVPTYNTPVKLLARLLASVQAQWYSEWELIFADDASTAVETRGFLGALNDQGIMTVFGETNAGISAATNLGLEQATGDFVVFLDHDDELTEDCLFELACSIAHWDADFIYSDEDKIAPDGSLTEPFFKPDWSPDTLMSTMYTCHVSCVRRQLLEELGGLRSEYDGAQDWDLTLRVAEKTDKIVHIPKVLYHWRRIADSSAADFNAKPYAIEAGRKARVDALRRRGISAAVEPLPQIKGHFRVRYHLDSTPLVSIVIPTRDNGAILRRCIASIIERSSYRNFEIIVLDNGSVAENTLRELRILAELKSVTIIRHDAPFNYSALNNIGARHAHGDILLFLNDDTEVVSKDWLERMGGYAQQPHIGAVGAKLLYPESRTVQHSGVINLSSGPGHAFLKQPAEAPGYFARNLLEYDWIAVTGACMMIERQKFDRVAQFDETMAVAYNDVELCFRLLRAGYYNVVCQAVQLLHYESVTRGKDFLIPSKQTRLDRDRRALYLRHPNFLAHDPFYSPNLAPDSVHFDIAS